MTAGEQLIEIGRAEGMEQGRAEGREQGALIGEIRTLERVLGLKASNWDDLIRCSVRELRERLEALARQAP